MTLMTTLLTLLEMARLIITPLLHLVAQYPRSSSRDPLLRRQKWLSLLKLTLAATQSRTTSTRDEAISHYSIITGSTLCPQEFKACLSLKMTVMINLTVLAKD